MKPDVIYIEKDGSRFPARIVGCYGQDGKLNEKFSGEKMIAAKASLKPLACYPIYFIEGEIPARSKNPVTIQEFAAVRLAIPGKDEPKIPGKAAPAVKTQLVPVLNLMVQFGKPGNETAVDDVTHSSFVSDGKACWEYAE